uniref:RING-type E3 ubiquitin transferase n=1 Tax=Oryza punctata TaxID=4537 RepID=A0A0E0LVP9_ORYPU
MSASSPPPADAEAVPLFYCYECESTVSLPPPPPPPSRPLFCPRCRSEFLEEEENPNPPPEEVSSPPPPPPPPPGFLSDSSSDDEGRDLDLGMGGMDAATARAYLSRLVHHHLYDEPIDVAAAAVSVLQRSGLHQGGGENAPAPAASIAALPTVEVSEPAAACAICKDDLPLAAPARRLPCGHLYHSECIVQWLEMRNSCPVCRSRLPSDEPQDAAAPSDQGPAPMRITIRLSTNRRRVRTSNDAAPPVAASPTQLAQAVTGEGGGGPANSTETVSSEWPPPSESDAVMSDAREGQRFFD